METNAYFTNIRAHILSELTSSTTSIFVAVAWFTDVKLFQMLCKKASEGLDVQLIIVDDNINSASPINYNNLTDAGGKFFLIDSQLSGNLMHNKFCIIDGETTITGSYNWSIRAGSNHENITITKGNIPLADSFLTEFKRIKIQYHGQDPLKAFDLELINKRLNVIKGLIDLDEPELINPHLNKISEFELTLELIGIIDLIKAGAFKEAASSIGNYLKKAQALTFDDESRLMRLRWEIKYLEIEIVSLENERSTIQKLIADFVHSYTMAFGELIKKILKLKRDKLAEKGSVKEEQFAKAQDDYNRFEEQYRVEKKRTILELSEDDKKEMDRLKRKAVVLCHPDKFPGDPDMQRKAETVFKELINAYDKNDLEKVREILFNLENGIYDISEDTSVSKREQLEQQLEGLKVKLEKLKLELMALYNDKNYKDIRSIKNMDEYFEMERIRYESELRNLKDEK